MNNISLKRSKRQRSFLIVSLLILLATLSEIFSPYILVLETYKVSSKDLNERKVYLFKKPLFASNIRLDVIGLDKQCKLYIADGFIQTKVYLKGASLNGKNIEKIPVNTNIQIEMLSKKNLKRCDFEFRVSDPYGNLIKKMILTILPLLTVFYMLFRMIWVEIDEWFFNKNINKVDKN